MCSHDLPCESLKIDLSQVPWGVCMKFVLDQIRKHMTTLTARLALIFVTLVGCCSAAIGQETRLATQSLHCAAIFEVLGQGSNHDAQQAAPYAKATDIFIQVHLQELPQPVSASTRETVLQKRSNAVHAMRAAWLAKDAALREEAVLCGAWAEGFLAQGDRIQFVPVFPKVVAPGVRSQYQILLDERMGR